MSVERLDFPVDASRCGHVLDAERHVINACCVDCYAKRWAEARDAAKARGK